MEDGSSDDEADTMEKLYGHTGSREVNKINMTETSSLANLDRDGKSLEDIRNRSDTHLKEHSGVLSKSKTSTFGENSREEDNEDSKDQYMDQQFRPAEKTK